MYTCINCGRNVETDLKISRKIQCSYCGHRVLRKKRPDVVKKVFAE